MKKFLVRFLIWFTILFLASILVDWIVSSGLRKTDIRRYAVWNDIYGSEIDADLVVIGNSQAWCSYNTFIMDSMLGYNTYNLGIDGHSLHFQLIRYETYRRFNPKPKVILLNVCYFGTFSIMADEAYDREQFFPYIDDRALISQVAETKHITWLDRYVPLCRYFGYQKELKNGMSAFFGNKDFQDGGMHKGFRGNDYSWSSKGIPKELSDSHDMRLVDELERFAGECDREKIKLVFVKYPMCYPVLEHIRNLRECDSIFETIAAKYNMPILDFYYSDITKDSTNYYNYGHLNRKGAKLFTIELCRELDSIGIE